MTLWPEADHHREADAVSAPAPISLVLVDRGCFTIEGMKHVFASELDMRVVTGCADYKLVPSALQTHRPDVVVLSISRPDDFTLVERIAALRTGEGLTTKTIVMRDQIGDEEVLWALRHGVAAVVLKEMPPSSLVRCVRKIHSGGQWVESHSVGKVVERMLQREAGAAELARTLTIREVQVVRLMSKGLSNRGIAIELHVSEGTIKTHLHHVYEKLQVRSRIELTLYARDRCWT